MQVSLKNEKSLGKWAGLSPIYQIISEVYKKKKKKKKKKFQFWVTPNTLLTWTNKNDKLKMENYQIFFIVLNWLTITESLTSVAFWFCQVLEKFLEFIPALKKN